MRDHRGRPLRAYVHDVASLHRAWRIVSHYDVLGPGSAPLSRTAQVRGEHRGLAVREVPGRGQQGERTGAGELTQVAHCLLPLGLGQLGR
jgi:hypothetical protein